ncbi:MAG: hypothetical protein H7235_05140 [Bdellovibrionaceae bacterium]|nr:hypothetical protein [Pseudobdellovibrionaceae bacterium]
MVIKVGTPGDNGRAGGASYLIKTSDIDISLSVTTEIRSRTSSARFYGKF